jgi:hypothetical protein
MPLHLTLGCILMRCQDHVIFLNDLPTGMTLAQEIVVSLIFSITEILAIENHISPCRLWITKHVKDN